MLLDRTLWSRVKTVWKLAFQEQKSTIEKIGVTPSESNEDLETPLQQTTVKTLQDLWDTRYHLVLKPELRPADSLVGRIYREMSRRIASIIPIRKVRSLTNAAEPKPGHRVALDARSFVTFNSAEGTSIIIDGVVQYYYGLRILANAYAFAGIELVDSVQFEGKRVVCTPLDTNMDYADDCLRI